MPVIPALMRLRKEDHNFQANLGFTARPCLKKKKDKKYSCVEDPEWQ
jgi:hypothetical protein